MLNEINSSLALIVTQTKNNTPYLIDIFITLWGVFFINLLIGKRLFFLGIIPRSPLGIPGIICAPFLHADFNHLFFNTIPLIVLSNFILVDGVNHFLVITTYITIMSGVLTWIFAKNGIHIGASSLITGYWAYLISNTYQKGTITAIILGFICVYYFIGIFYSLFPGKKGVSWEGHVFGFIAGIITSLA